MAQKVIELSPNLQDSSRGVFGHDFLSNLLNESLPVRGGHCCLVVYSFAVLY